MRPLSENRHLLSRGRLAEADGRVVRAEPVQPAGITAIAVEPPYSVTLLMPGPNRDATNPGHLTRVGWLSAPFRRSRSIRIISRMLQDKGTPVYTIHAEVEGIVHQPLFEDLLVRARDAGIAT